MNCAMAVYNALATVNENKTVPPMPRAEGGKCGTVLAAEQIIREMFGSLKCAELRGMVKNKCNDYVGSAAAMIAEMMSV